MFGRGPDAEAHDTTPADDPATSAPSGKGHATPSRKQAEAQRKAALKGKPVRGRSGAGSAGSAADRARERERMMAGDESALLPRDRGPVRRFARNFVDSRRNAGELFLPGALLILVLGFIKNLTVQQASLWIWFAMVLVIAVDTWVMVRALKRALRTALPQESGSGVAFYATMRALQIRRLRVPRPVMKPGDTPQTGAR